MDRVIGQPGSARSLRERVESRRARRQRFSALVSTIEDVIQFATDRPAPPRASVSRSERARRSFSKENISRQKAVPGSYAPLASQLGWNLGLHARQAAVGSHPPSGSQATADALPSLKKLGIEFIVAVLLVACVGLGGLSLGRNAHKSKAKSPEPTSAPAMVVPTIKPGEEKLQILLLGSDQREKDNSFRTDVVILLTVDTVNGQASMLSFPRDLVGKIPGYGDGRINIAMQQGGFSLLHDTLQDSFGANPRYYFLINFSGFVGVINSIGGIEVDAAEALTDSCDLYWSKAGMCSIEPGRHTMDGETALWYVRSRHTSSDFDRLRRAQEVMTAVFARFMQMNATMRLPELFVQYNQDVDTNMGIGQIASLIPTAIKIASDPARVHRYAIPSEITADWIMADGARVLLPDYEAVKEIVKEATFGK